MDFTQYLAAARASFAEIVRAAREYLPNLVAALALVLAGWLLARLLRAWSVRLIRGLDRVAERWRVDSALRRAGLRRPLAEALGTVVFWLVFLFFLTAATEALGLPALSAWLTGIAYFVPRVVAAALVLLAGLLAANLIRDAIVAASASAGVAYGGALAQIVRFAVLLVTGLIAVNELGIDVTVVTVTLGVALGAVLGGAALAFGLGARTAVSNIIGAHYLRQVVRVGQTVRLGDAEGEVSAITATSVVLDTPRGRVVVPAKTFSETVSTLVTVRGDA